MTIWKESTDLEAPADLQAAAAGHTLVAQTLVQRGILTADQVIAFLDPARYPPSNPFDLPGMDRAVQRLKIALEKGEHVLVWGDFDVDGQTATAILVSALAELGGTVSWHLPVRERESHGVNIPVLSELLGGRPDVLLTCDTGISSHDALAYATRQGLDVIVSDHHQLPARMPDALAVVNPQMLSPEHPMASLPGAGVAYKLVEGLSREVGAGLDCERYLDLAALGIIADLATLRGESRYLVQRGLQAMRKAQRTGIQVMLELADVQPIFLTEEHVGFELAPRLNALGRIGDANPLIELLTTTDRSKALTLAYSLESANNQRKLLSSQILQAALALINQDKSVLDEPVLVLSHPTWPAGVLGIVANQLVERYHKPVVLVSLPAEGLGRGSARSINGINITQAIAANADLLLNFGGHPMAAGFAIPAENWPRFRIRINRTVAQMGVPSESVLNIDGTLPIAELSLDLVADLERLAPFGPGNPALILASPRMRLLNHHTVGRSQEHLLLTLEDENHLVSKVIWWQGAGWNLPAGQFDLAYQVRASTYRGQRDLQIEWIDYRSVADGLVEEIKPSRQVVDLRGQNQPLSRLQKLLSDCEDDDVQVFAEGEARHRLAQSKVIARSRTELIPGKHLVIWTPPPEPAVWQAILKQVDPQVITLFAVAEPPELVQDFLERLAGLVKYGLKHKRGELDYQQMAIATAQSILAVRLGIEWLASQGVVHIQVEDGVPQAGAGGTKDDQRSAELLAGLQSVVDETRAYRSFFARALGESLLQVNE